MKTRRRALITGAAGQLGRGLLAQTPDDMDIAAYCRSELDVGNARSVASVVRDVQPTVIINTAAYTAVDAAESDAHAAAYTNVEGVRNLARAASSIPGARLIHISTDYVFDGRTSMPYRPSDDAAPLSVYGRTKLAGEREALAALAARALILRTGWLYAAHGRNFVRGVLASISKNGEVHIVDDQVGAPTTVASLARVIWALAGRPVDGGVYHWSDAGVVSRYGFALAIAAEAQAAGLLSGTVRVLPTATRDRPTPATRPAYSVLDTRLTQSATGITPAHWRLQLRSVIGELALA